MNKEEALRKIEELKKYIRDKEKINIKNDFIWYEEENEDLDFSKIESIGGNAYLQGCSSDLSSLKKIGGIAGLRGCSADLSSLESINSYADLQGCTSDLSSLDSIGGDADLRGCTADLSSLESIGGWSIGGWADLKGCTADLRSLESIDGSAYLQGASKKLKKSLAKTLRKCGNIYVEFRDKPMSLDEFRDYANNL